MFPNKPSNHSPVAEWQFTCLIDESSAEDILLRHNKRKIAVKGPSEALVEFLKSLVMKENLY